MFLIFVVGQITDLGGPYPARGLYFGDPWDRILADGTLLTVTWYSIPDLHFRPNLKDIEVPFGLFFYSISFFLLISFYCLSSISQISAQQIKIIVEIIAKINCKKRWTQTFARCCIIPALESLFQKALANGYLG